MIRTMLILLVLVTGCSTPLAARISWQEPGKAPSVRIIEFEKYELDEGENSMSVLLDHEASYSPWETNRHYAGESVWFSFEPEHPDGQPAAVIEGGYRLKAAVFFDVTFIEGFVVPVPDDPESPGDFRLIFDTSNFGEHISTITITGRLRR